MTEIEWRKSENGCRYRATVPFGKNVTRISPAEIPDIGLETPSHRTSSRPIAGIGEGVIEATDLAARPQPEKALEQVPAPAARTTTGEAGANRRELWLIGHDASCFLRV